MSSRESYIAGNARDILLLLCSFAIARPGMQYEIELNNVTVIAYMGLQEFDANIHAFDHIEKVCLQNK